jgi:hypothetical protein
MEWQRQVRGVIRKSSVNKENVYPGALSHCLLQRMLESSFPSWYSMGDTIANENFPYKYKFPLQKSNLFYFQSFSCVCCFSKQFIQHNFSVKAAYVVLAYSGLLHLESDFCRNKGK